MVYNKLTRQSGGGDFGGEGESRHWRESRRECERLAWGEEREDQDHDKTREEIKNVIAKGVQRLTTAVMRECKREKHLCSLSPSLRPLLPPAAHSLRLLPLLHLAAHSLRLLPLLPLPPLTLSALSSLPLLTLSALSSPAAHSLRPHPCSSPVSTPAPHSRPSHRRLRLAPPTPNTQNEKYVSLEDISTHKKRSVWPRPDILCIEIFVYLHSKTHTEMAQRSDVTFGVTYSLSLLATGYNALLRGLWVEDRALEAYRVFTRMLDTGIAKKGKWGMPWMFFWRIYGGQGL
ncbi:hypothetical protein Syun_008473 [Stephania yunnanensis]|uniref:Pentatricopeptide repeat-containing protein n=1 Tax=Stephania yunnanensis TaxID=152371 RepID=A0AAP0KER8_9MAGN